jgi:membrane protease YdiL (CAAX protease family)
MAHALTRHRRSGGTPHEGRLWSRRNELLVYFVLTFAFSWAVQLPLALAAQGVISASPPMAAHYLAAFGPLLAALVVTLSSRGVNGTRELFGRLLRWRIPGRLYAFAVAAPAALFGAVVLITGLADGRLPDVGSLGRADYLGDLAVVPVLLLWMTTYGLGEEVGWRGFALPRLQATRSALGASLLLGLFWALWHLPALFYRDTYVDMGWMVVPMLLTIATAGPVVYTWLFNASRGSLLPVILLHGLFDFFSVWEGGLLGGVVGAGMVLTIFLVFWAVRVFKLYGAENLAPCAKVSR